MTREFEFEGETPVEGDEGVIEAPQQGDKSQDTPPPAPTVESLSAELGDMKKSFEEAQRMIGRQSEEIGLYRQYLQNISTRLDATGQPPGQTGGQTQQQQEAMFSEADGLRLLEQPHVALNDMAQKILNAVNDVVQQRYSQVDSQQQYLQQLREGFYQKHADLVPYQPIVSVIAEQVFRANPQAMPHLLLDNIAQGTRDYLKQLGVNIEKSAPNVSGGGGTASRGSQMSTGVRRTPVDESQKELSSLVSFVDKIGGT